MAGTIKGITVEIGGNTTGLGKALEGVNKQTRDLQSELKQVDKLLKLDPKNTELLKQKQELLGKAVESTTTKLDALKTAQKQSGEELQKTEEGKEQYRALEREIVSTEEKLKSLKKQSTESNSKLSKIGDTAEAIGSKAEAMGKKLLPLTVAIAAVGAAAVTSFEAVDEGADTVLLKTGATGAAAEDLEKIYQNVASKIIGNFDDIGATVGEVSTRLDLTGAALETASEQFLKFSTINKVDATTSVKTVSRAMAAAGVDASKYADFLDMLTVAGQKSGASVDTLAEDITNYKGTLTSLGLSTQEQIALLVAFEKSGVNADSTLAGLKKATTNWSKAGKDSTIEFKKTLEAIKAAPDVTSAAGIAIEAFGSKAGTELADAIRTGRFEYEDYVAAIQNSSGAVEATYSEAVDGADSAKLSFQNFKIALSGLGETILTAIGPIFEKLAGWARDVSDWFGGLDESTKKTILTILAVVAALGPALIIFGTVARGIKRATDAIKGLSDVFTWLAANPIVIVIAAVAGLVIALTNLWKNNENFRNFIISTWTAISTFIGGIVNAIAGFFTGLWNGIVSVYSGVTGFFTGIFTGAWNGIVSAFTAVGGFFAGLWEAIKAPFIAVADWFSNIFSAAWAGVKNVFSAGGKIFDGIKDGIANVFKSVVNGIISGLNAVIAVPFKVINGILNGIKNINILGLKPFNGLWGYDPLPVPQIPKLAKGGILTDGMAIVAEAGPELLSMKNGKTTVTPLSGSSRNTSTGNTFDINVNLYNGQYTARDGQMIARDVSRRLGLSYR